MAVRRIPSEFSLGATRPVMRSKHHFPQPPTQAPRESSCPAKPWPLRCY